ncbi:hypothetical protein Clacol_009287 [Clathrus columnatus]|uniref:non-specific serine/threonine protein kinase n=1 Tax=Clathrus columnatus TaxID=1419009 RepID=A0AAV5AK64_9AGAM|nr:hypothetical protein Clacol_009287 [Clathrus columnatus]
MLEEDDNMISSLPILRDYFDQQGHHGRHYYFLTDPLSTNIHTLRLSAPTGRLGVHIVKPILACRVEALEALHLRNIIHADLKADDLFWAPNMTSIEEMIDKNPPILDGTFTTDNGEYPILRPEPFQSGFSWDVTPCTAELIQVMLSNFDAELKKHVHIAVWADKPKLVGDIGSLALRAPENIIRAECGKEIDIWAIGCMTYELITGESLFQSQDIPGLTPDESLLLLQFAVTGETLSKDIIDQSRVRDKFFNSEGEFIKSSANIYPDRSMKERLTERCGENLTERQINAAARFIRDCLRLNPRDRPTVDELSMHSWLSMAFMVCADRD